MLSQWSSIERMDWKTRNEHITDHGDLSDMGINDGVMEEVMEQACMDDHMDYQNFQAIDDEVDIVMNEFDNVGVEAHNDNY